MNRYPLLLVAATLAAFSAAPAQQPADPPPAPASPAQGAAATPAAELNVGSDAPALRPLKWLQGDPVTAWEPGKTYLIECWGTWCPPCVRMIPHVNALQKKFADQGFVAIGVAVWERSSEAKVAEFVKAKGEGMVYRVAYDGEAGPVAKDWLDAADVKAVPHSFVVRDGKIIWRGHPQGLTEAVVARMVAGQHQPEKYVAEQAERAQAKVALNAGDPAPEFKPARWIQGEPVAAFEPGKTYLIECWATWCAPCLALIPHVNALQQKFADKGLVVIGTCVGERKSGDEIAAFVKDKGVAMSYRVIYDGDDGPIAASWLRPAMVSGLPHGFVVRDGTIIWRGHPGTLTDEVMARMVAGEHKVERFVDPAIAEREAARARNQRTQELGAEIQRLTEAKDYDAALAQIDELAKLNPGQTFPYLNRHLVLVRKGDVEGIKRNLADCAKATSDKDGYSLAHIATMHMVEPALEGHRDPAVIDDLMRRAIAAEPDDEYVRFAQARHEYFSGRKDAALATLAALAETCQKPGIVDELRAAHAALKAGQPWPGRPAPQAQGAGK